VISTWIVTFVLPICCWLQKHNCTSNVDNDYYNVNDDKESTAMATATTKAVTAMTKTEADMTKMVTVNATTTTCATAI